MIIIIILSFFYTNIHRACITRDNRNINMISIIISIITIVVVVVINVIVVVIFPFEFDNIVNINNDHQIIKERLRDYNGYKSFYYFIIIE